MLAYLITQFKTFLPFAYLQDPLLNVQLWQYTAGLLLFFGLRLTILSMARLLLRILPTKTSLYFILEKIHKTHSYTLALLIFIENIIGYLALPSTSSPLSLIITTLHVLCAILLLFLSYGIVDGLFLYLQKIILSRSKKHIYFLPFFKKIAKIVTTLICVILLPRCFVIYNLTNLLGSLSLSIGLVTTAVAFALKDTIHNFIGGITIIMNNLLHARDTIKADGIEGKVVQMNLRTTIVKTANGAKVHIPNSIFITKKFTNYGNITKKSVTMQLTCKNLASTHITPFLEGFNEVVQQYSEAITKKCKVELSQIKGDILHMTFDLIFMPISENQSILYTCQIVNQLKKLATKNNMQLVN